MPLNALTIDVEDYYQVSAFDDTVAREDWDDIPGRVEGSTRRLLGLFEAHGVQATFFLLGWVAERHPELVREIHAAGHEIASHGHGHELVSGLDRETFRRDLRRAAEAIQAAVPGLTVEGYRAPSFSITYESLWAYDVLREEGYTFSSSAFPVRHDRYGLPGFPKEPVRLIDGRGRSLWEVPLTTLRVAGMDLPAAGGGWLRLLPAAMTARAIQLQNARGAPAVVYVHPWEVDPEQPVIAGASRSARLRHRLNLRRTHARLDHLLGRFRFGTLSQVLAERDEAGARTLRCTDGAPIRETRRAAVSV